ncbi:Ankyrin repeat-containing protein yar1, partial [Globisporangium splendens]
MSDALLTSARYGDDDEIRELLQEAAIPEQQDRLVNYVQEDTKNTPLHMGTRPCMPTNACFRCHCSNLLWVHDMNNAICNSMCEWTRCVREGVACAWRASPAECKRQLPVAYVNMIWIMLLLLSVVEIAEECMESHGMLCYFAHVDWAVQNRHLACVKLLLDGIPDIDVLAQNGFGRGSVTEAFQSDDTDILSALLEHKSATEERLVAGSVMDNATIREEDDEEEETKGDDDEGGSPKIIQETVLQFGFDKALPVLKARELALDWNKDAFGTTADEDITGVSIWSASLILSRWVIDHASEFDSKQVCELGSGCGVSGIASFLYTKASRVVLSDLFNHTLRNLEHNVALNKQATTGSSRVLEPEDEEKAAGCAHCGIAQRFTADNPEGKLMKCGACRAVEYCSRECQKKAWITHKVQCKELRASAEASKQTSRALEVAAIDWAKPETWPQQGNDKFDVLIGSDLVYHEEIVPVLVNVVDGLVKQEGGKFIHVASQARNSLVEFKQAMEARGFTCDVQVVPESYKENPLTGDDAAVELFHLHFNEMSDIYCTYIFERRAQ